MKQIKVETESGGVKMIQLVPPPPPPPVPLSNFWVKKIVIEESVTNKEIAKFWRQKHVEEEEHLLAAIKAAARIRARNLSDEDYRFFEESLKDMDNNDSEEQNDENDEIRVGIKDWWTKSKYAYLNQPAIGSLDMASKRRVSSYTPNCLSYKPTPLYPSTLGVF